MLIHNNGNPIITNIISNEDLDYNPLMETPKNSDNEEENDITDNNLFAVYTGERNGIQYESYVFSNSTEISNDEIVLRLEKMDHSMTATLNQDSATVATKAKQYYRNVSMAENCWKGSKAIITSTFSFIRRTSNADIDGKKGSIWDVACKNAQLETSNCYIRDFYTWINTNQPNQKLLSWGPIEDKSVSGTNSVSLSGMGIPSWSDTVLAKGFARKTDTSKSGKYGKWKFYTTSYNQDKLIVEPAIRVSNTKGSLVIKVKHQAGVTRMFSVRKFSDFNTGAQEFTFSDQ